MDRAAILLAIFVQNFGSSQLSYVICRTLKAKLLNEETKELDKYEYEF
jgi:hypothetical protein